MLTAIATSKSTVLGLRLDHDRRAWVEGAAAQAGLTVRGFFEGLIDRARLEAAGGSVAPEASPGEVGAHATPGRPGDVGEGRDHDTRGEAIGTGDRTVDRGPRPRPTPEVPRLLLFPGQVLGAATSATATLIESGGRCLRDTWRVFLVTLLQGDEDGPSSPR